MFWGVMAFIVGTGMAFNDAPFIDVMTVYLWGMLCFMSHDLEVLKRGMRDG